MYVHACVRAFIQVVLDCNLGEQQTCDSRDIKKLDEDYCKSFHTQTPHKLYDVHYIFFALMCLDVPLFILVYRHASRLRLYSLYRIAFCWGLGLIMLGFFIEASGMHVVMVYTSPWALSSVLVTSIAVFHLIATCMNLLGRA